jgi:hypothetical protein
LNARLLRPNIQLVSRSVQVVREHPSPRRLLGICTSTLSPSFSKSLPAQNAQQAPPPSSELIREIQQRLFDLNDVVWPDGSWDDRTKAAIKNCIGLQIDRCRM